VVTARWGNRCKGPRAVKKACIDHLCPTSIDGDLQSARTLGDVSTVAFAGAGIGAVAGVLAFVLGRNSEPRPAEDSLRPWVSLGSAGVRGSF
jgi:hypothetical protein